MGTLSQRKYLSLSQFSPQIHLASLIGQTMTMKLNKNSLGSRYIIPNPTAQFLSMR